MAKRRDRTEDLTPDEALASTPFAGLAGLREQLPEGDATPTQASTQAASTDADRDPSSRGPARAIVRYQRKGRGGKEATLVEQLGLSEAVLDAWSRELKQALGCGGQVEGTLLVFGGDQRKRLPAMLEARGVRRVTVS
jgi:translation initiation factor 1